MIAVYPKWMFALPNEHLRGSCLGVSALASRESTANSKTHAGDLAVEHVG
jgi:hypothetical protein